MDPKTLSEEFVQNMLCVFPYWNSNLVRPFRETLNREMSLETYYCLEMVRRYDSVTMTELAGYLRVPKQQATKLVDKLAECHFVDRMPDEHDRRLIRILLTEKAKAYLDEYYKKNTDFIERLERRLTADQLTELNYAVSVLQKLLPLLEQ